MLLRKLRTLCCTLCKTFGLIYSLLKAKCIDLSLLIDYSCYSTRYFKDVMQYIRLLSIQSGVKISQIQLILVSAFARGLRRIGVSYKGKYKTLISGPGFVSA